MIDKKEVQDQGVHPMVTHTITAQGLSELVQIFKEHQPNKLKNVLSKHGYAEVPKWPRAVEALPTTRSDFDADALGYVMRNVPVGMVLTELLRYGVTTNQLKVAGFALPEPEPDLWQVSVEGASAPIAVHNSVGHAEKEAERLAMKYPNTPVRILRIVGTRRVVQTTEMKKA